MSIRHTILAGALLGAMAIAPAQAGSITVSENGTLGTASADIETQLSGFPGYLPTNFQTDPNSPDGYHNGIVTLAAGTYHLQYWGSGNSVFDNFFTVNASPDYTITGINTISSIGPGGTGGYTAGIIEVVVTNLLGATLDFTYSTSGPPGCTIQSGSADISECDYLAGVDGALVSGSSTTGTVGYLGFSDRNEGIDHDHQDLTIFIAAVPEPATLGLFGLALAGLGLAGRRRVRG